MKYIVLSYDLSDEDFDAERDDLVDEYLEDQGFDYVTDEGPVPSTIFVKEAGSDAEDLEKIRQGVIDFCQKNGLKLVSLLVCGPAPITQFCSDEGASD